MCTYLAFDTEDIAQLEILIVASRHLACSGREVFLYLDKMTKRSEAWRQSCYKGWMGSPSSIFPRLL